MNRFSGLRKTACGLLYALAAGAIGMSVLALTQTAEAKIVYTHAHVIIRGFGGYYKLDLNHDGITDFSITCGCTQYYGLLSANPAADNGVVGSGKYASVLSPGAQIGSGEAFITGSAEMENEFNDHCYLGNWCNVTGYLGLNFMIMGKPHYGWARLSVRVDSSGMTAALRGYAYETIPGKAIIAGRTKGPADREEASGPGASLTNPIPDKRASLGMLALGAQGDPLWRRKESALEGVLEGGI
jgi:hypothetical protein